MGISETIEELILVSEAKSFEEEYQDQIVNLPIPCSVMKSRWSIVLGCALVVKNMRYADIALL